MKRQEEIRKLAFKLWEDANKPAGHELDFWLAAESEVDRTRICVLTPGTCPHQHSQPLSGGRHCAICNGDSEKCRYRASGYNSACTTLKPSEIRKP